MVSQTTYFCSVDTSQCSNIVLTESPYFYPEEYSQIIFRPQKCITRVFLGVWVVFFNFKVRRGGLCSIYYFKYLCLFPYSFGRQLILFELLSTGWAEIVKMSIFIQCFTMRKGHLIRIESFNALIEPSGELLCK